MAENIFGIQEIHGMLDDVQGKVEKLIEDNGQLREHLDRKDAKVYGLVVQNHDLELNNAALEGKVKSLQERCVAAKNEAEQLKARVINLLAENAFLRKQLEEKGENI